MGFQSLVKVIAQELVGSTRFLIDNLTVSRCDTLINDLPPPGIVYATSMLAARARSCNALIVGTAATQRGRWPQFSVMKSSRKSAVLLGSTVTGFNVGGGAI